tara:strand:- start:148 stop:354 length:207 start_codon:yes stop_codon:yes gene_type:complete
MKLTLKSYFKPTPKLFRVIGDTLLTIGTMITSYQIISNEKTLAIISLIIMIVGKFTTNLASLDQGEGN